MKLHVLFGHRKESYEGEYAPEPLLCWSEYEVEENTEGFEEALTDTLKQRGREFAATRVFIIHIDGDKIRRHLVEAPELTGRIELED